MRRVIQNKKWTYVEDGLNSYCQSHFWDFAHISAEEPRIGLHSIVCQCLHSRAARKARAWFVKGNMPVWSDTTEEELDATGPHDFLLVCETFSFEVGGRTGEKMHIGRFNINVREEVGVHKGMV